MENGNGHSGALVRQDNFSGQQLATVQETASAAVAAQAKAAVEARWIVAMRQPRNLDQVRAELLRECKRPSFAEVARYRKPIGQGVEGLSIRFVEQALQLMGNADSEAITIYDDDDKRIIEVRVTDFERNVCHRKQITVSKRVERRQLRRGQTAIGRRTNSYGDTVYIVQATDDELLNKEAALVSKALRTCGLRLIPGWLQDEAEQQILATLADRAAKDPDAERRKLCDAFAALNVLPDALEDYLGHSLATVSPAELVELREVYTTVRDGQTTWQAVVENRQEQETGPQAAPEQQQKPPHHPAEGKGSQAVKDRLKAKTKTKAKAKAKAKPKQATPEPEPAATSTEAKDDKPDEPDEPDWMKPGWAPPEGTEF